MVFGRGWDGGVFSRKCVGWSFTTSIFNDLWDTNMTKRRAAERSRWWDQTDGGNFSTQQTLTCWFSHFLTRKNTLICVFSYTWLRCGRLFLNIRFSRVSSVSFAPQIFNHIYHFSETQTQLSDSLRRSQTPAAGCMFVTCWSETCRTVWSLSLCCCRDSSSYT